MASGDINYWIGGTTAAAMVKTATPGGTIEAGDKFITVIDDTNGNSETLSVSATNTTVAITCDDIIAAITALPATSLFKTLVTATDSTTCVTFTAATAGVPFELTLSTTESDDSPADAQTYVEATTTARAGPLDWGVDGNWSLGTVPVTGEKVYVDKIGKSHGISYGLSQASVTLAELNIFDDYTGNLAWIGTTTADLAISATLERIGLKGAAGNGAGCGRIRRNAGTVQTTLEVYKTAAAGTDSGYEPYRWKGTHASNAIVVNGGLVGIATTNPNEQATVATITATGGRVNCGPRVTLTTINNRGGTIIAKSALTTLNQYKGTTETLGDVLVGTANNYGGIHYFNNRVSGNDVTTYNLRGGTLDASQNPVAFTIGTGNLYKGTIKLASPSQMTITTPTVNFDTFTQITIGASA